MTSVSRRGSLPPAPARGRAHERVCVCRRGFRFPPQPRVGPSGLVAFSSESACESTVPGIGEGANVHSLR